MAATVLKEGQLFLVADRDGDIKALNLEGQGLYYRDRRHLSLYEMAINGTRLTLLSSAGELNFMSNLQFTNDLLLGSDSQLLAEPRTISIARQRFVSGSLHERVELLSYNPHPITLIVRFTCGSDFRDMFDVRGFDVDELSSAETGVEPIQIRDDGVVLGYHGRGGTRRRTHIVFDPLPEHVEIVNATLKRLSRAENPNLDHRDEGTVVPPIAAMQFEIELPPGTPRTITVSVTPEADHYAEPPSPPNPPLPEPGRGGLSGSSQHVTPLPETGSGGLSGSSHHVTPLPETGSGGLSGSSQHFTPLPETGSGGLSGSSQQFPPLPEIGRGWQGGSGSNSPVDIEARCDAIRESYAEWRSSSTRVETDNELFDLLLNRAALDVRLLVESFDGNLVPTAGIPWFAVPFGRDSLIVSTQTLSLQPAIARGTLRFLARHQGRQLNPLRGEAPGKILHEIRPGATGTLADSVFYGSIDSTPLFLTALGEYVNWSGDVALADELLPNAEAALEWMASYGDADGDGFLECTRYPSSGLGDQGWKDSPDSMNHTHGQPAEQPVALAEVQAYAFSAHRGMARIYRCLGEADKERSQRAAADRVRALFLQRLAMRDEYGPYWAMGIDARGRRIESVTTNPGHALWTGLLSGADAQATAGRLVLDDMLCGWGIRTLSARARSYNPMSYHNGSVWPHDNALIALGMKRAGADAAARTVATQIFEAGLLLPGSRLPELWCGFARDARHNSSPGQYPVGCSPQGWAAGSAFMLLQALLGLEVEALAGVVRLRPSLPEWLGRISVRELRVADRQIDFDVVREGHRLRVDVLDDGGLKVEAREVAEAD
jgi:glycogen debranching enzyme